MTGFLLEAPWRLTIVAVAVQFALICLWSVTRARPAGRAVWIGFAAWTCMLVVSVVVVTRRERIIEWCHDMALLVERGDVAGIMDRIDGEFDVRGLGRDDFERGVTAALAKYRIDRPKLRRFKVDLPDDDHAVVEFQVTCRVRSAEVFVDSLLSRWRVQLRHRHQTWLATSVEAVPTPLSPIRDLNDWLR